MREQEIRDLYEAYLQVHQPRELSEETFLAENNPFSYDHQRRPFSSPRKEKETSQEKLQRAAAAGAAALGFGALTEPAARDIRRNMRANRPSPRSGPSGRLGNSGTSSGNILPRSASERSGLPPSFRPSARGGAGSGSFTADEYDYYDIILSHLLDEGYADTNENALVIMTNMSEEWKQSIVEDTINEGAKYSDNDYRGGGGDEKRLRTGMSTREVQQLGRKNIDRAIGKEPLGTRIKQTLFGREVPVPPNAGFKPGGWRMMTGSGPGTTADPLPGPRARYHGPAR